jgi:hypothetical protein
MFFNQRGWGGGVRNSQRQDLTVKVKSGEKKSPSLAVYLPKPTRSLTL